MKNHLIVVVGPTAIGKTKVAIDIAQYFNTEIISSDSRQFFKEMSIGTAVPPVEELNKVQHHFIQHISIQQKYSVGDFEREALAFISDFFTRKSPLVMAGGSGLYEKAVTEGLDYFPDIPSEIREQLNEDFKNKGLVFLQNELKERDSTYYDRVDIYNPHRVIRALEIIRYTSKPYSFYLNFPKSRRPFNIIKIGLLEDREIIYKRINDRVDKMVSMGLLDEVKSLYDFKSLNALNTVGYKELFAYLDGVYSFSEAIEEIKKNTRRFAKRQLTWYRKDRDIRWFLPYQSTEMIQYIKEIIK